MDLLNQSKMFAPRAFAPQRTKALMALQLVKKTAVYVVPSDLTDEEKMAMGLLFALMATNRSASLEEWKSYVVSYTGFLIPGMIGKLPKESYSTISMSKATINPAITRILQYIRVAHVATEEENPMADDGLHGLSVHSGLPAIEAEAGYKWVGAEATAKHIFAHYALIVFLAGKTITDLNREAITTNRPRALVGKCHLDEETLILNGALRISDIGHEYITVAWSEVSIFRAHCFLEFMNYASMDTNSMQDIIYTSVHLLRHSGMTHARLSYKLIKANMWVVDFAPLQGPVSVFFDSLRESLRVPTALQPYLKLIYADKSNLFPRKEMEPLVACAVAVEEEMSDSITQFYRNERYQAIVELFMEERRARMKPTSRVQKITTLAELEERDSRENYDGEAPDEDEGDAEAAAGPDQAEEEQEEENDEEIESPSS
jgi:hypothetical protein